MTQSASLLNRGLKNLNNSSSVSAYTFIAVPLGSRILIIKDKEIELENPLLHLNSKLNNNNAYTYQEYDAYLSTGSHIKYDAIVYSIKEDLYFTITGTHTYNENNTRHYYLKQLDPSMLLILDSIDDPRFEDISKELYDVMSLPYLLTTLNNNGIACYPKELQVLNRDLLQHKAVFIQVLDSYTTNNGFDYNSGLNRIDTIRFYYNCYSIEEIYDLFKKFSDMIKLEDINIMAGNIFDIEQITDYGLGDTVTYYSQFNINYLLEPKNKIDIKKYIQSVLVTINEIRNKG